MQSNTLEERYAIKFCFKLGKNATETYGMFPTAFGASFMNRASIFEWHKRFKEGRESVGGDERCGRSKKVNTPELISQRVRVSLSIVLTLLPVTFGYSLSSEAETIEEMKEALTKVIDTFTQEDFHGTFQKLLEGYNRLIAARGDYFKEV